MLIMVGTNDLLEGRFTKIWPVDGLRSFGQRSTVAPRKSRADFLVQQQVIAQLEHSALRSAEKSVVQPVLPKTNISSSIRMARRKTRPEGVAERRGRKAWPEGVVGRRGRKAWSEGVLAGIAGLQLGPLAFSS